MMQAINDYGQFIGGLGMQPLRITAHLASSVVDYQGLRLDGILSYAVVEELTLGRMFPQDHPYSPIPIPVAVAWVNLMGVPLYHSTDLLPADNTKSSRYMHRRSLNAMMTKKNINTGSGMFKELRTPLPTLSAQTLTAHCIGNAEEIARLLTHVTSIGKKRTTNGTVDKWVVEEATDANLIQDGIAQCNLPFDYVRELIGSVDITRGSQMGFSPPYWHARTQWFCIPTGASC